MNNETIGTIPAERLLDMEAELLGKLRSRELTVKQFEKFLRRENPFQFPNAIEIGGFSTVGALLRALKSLDKVSLDRCEEVMLAKGFKLFEYGCGAEIKVVTLVQLGFTDAVTMKQVYERATSDEFRLKLCPAEVGPQLRLQYDGQPFDEYLWIAMEPITDSEGERNIFQLGNNRQFGQQLSACEVYEDQLWNINHKWVFFCRPSF